MTQLRHKESGKIFRVFNLHLDHESEEARVQGIKCAWEFVDEYNKKIEYPYFLLGDLNAEPDSETIKICDSREGLREVTGDFPFTFHEYFYTERRLKIDYIYMTDTIKVKKTEAWKDEIEGIYLSDHYPICTEVEI